MVPGIVSLHRQKKKVKEERDGKKGREQEDEEERGCESEFGRRRGKGEGEMSSRDICAAAMAEQLAMPCAGRGSRAYHIFEWISHRAEEKKRRGECSRKEVEIVEREIEGL